MLLIRESKFFFVFIFCLISISFCIEQPSILLLPFKSKGLQKEEEEDVVEPYQTEDENGWPHYPITPVFNASQFINKWFYNGMYIMSNINRRQIESYINMENSKLSIEKCNKNRIYTSHRDKSYYKP